MIRTSDVPLEAKQHVLRDSRLEVVRTLVPEFRGGDDRKSEPEMVREDASTFRDSIRRGITTISTDWGYIHQ
jgi:hypothetical protein